jgi:hypothetical protein
MAISLKLVKLVLFFRIVFSVSQYFLANGLKVPRENDFQIYSIIFTKPFLRKFGIILFQDFAWLINFFLFRQNRQMVLSWNEWFHFWWFSLRTNLPFQKFHAKYPRIYHHLFSMVKSISSLVKRSTSLRNDGIHCLINKLSVQGHFKSHRQL